MISGQFYALFNDPSANKQCVISTSDDGESIVITHDDLIADSMSLDSVLSSADDIVFGTCCGTQVEFKLNNTKLASLNDRVISIDYYFDGIDEPFKIGVFKVINDSIEADRRSRKVVAVDSTELIKKVDIAPWYNAIDFTTPITLRQLRTSLEAYMNLQYGIIFRWDTTEESPILCNDSLLIQKTIDSEHIEFADVISSICELNGTFFVHDDGGKYYYKTLSRQSQATLNSTVIPPVTFANYVVPGINRIVIRENDDDDGVAYPDLEDIDDGAIVNNYVIVGNFLTYGRTESTAEGSVQYAAQMLYNQIHDLSYIPVEAEAVGNPCIEIGDCITIHAANGVDENGYPVYEDIKTYIMERSLTGLKILKDKYTSSGSEVRETAIESSGSQIKQIKSATIMLRKEVNGIAAQVKQIQDNGWASTSVDILAGQITEEVTESIGDDFLKSEDGDITTGLRRTITASEMLYEMYTSASQQWTEIFKLNQNGAYFKGSIVADSLTLGQNVKINYDSIEDAPDLDVYIQQDSTIGSEPEEGVTGFKVTSTGLLQASNAIIYGTIYATDGRFSGDVIINSGTGVTNTVTADGIETTRNFSESGDGYEHRYETKSFLKEGQFRTEMTTEIGFYDEDEWESIRKSAPGYVDIGYTLVDGLGGDVKQANPYITLRDPIWTSGSSSTEIRSGIIGLSNRLFGFACFRAYGWHQGYFNDDDGTLDIYAGDPFYGEYDPSYVDDDDHRSSINVFLYGGFKADKFIASDYGVTCEIGPKNADYMRFDSNKPFYFNTEIYVGSYLHPYTTNTSYLGNSTHQWYETYSRNFVENGVALSDKYAGQKTTTYAMIQGGWHRLGLFGDTTIRSKAYLIEITNAYSYHVSRAITAILSIGYQSAKVTILSQNDQVGNRISKLGFIASTSSRYYLDAYFTAGTTGSSNFDITVTPLSGHAATKENFTLYTTETMETNPSAVFDSCIVIDSVSLQTGTGSINSNSYVTITFPKEFSSIPNVVATYAAQSMADGAPGPIKIKTITTTSFQAVIGGSWSGNMPIQWIATTG